MKIKSTLCAAILVSALAAASSMASAAPGKATGENKDYRTFYSDGRVDYGRIGDSYSADLVLYSRR